MSFPGVGMTTFATDMATEAPSEARKCLEGYGVRMWGNAACGPGKGSSSRLCLITPEVNNSAAGEGAGK
jgi:hypothetical protein